jgi:hypothetical protein
VTVDRKRFEQFLRRAMLRTPVDAVGRLLTLTVGEHVLATPRGRLRQLILGRVLAPHPVGMGSLDSVRDWWQLAVFSAVTLSWSSKPTFRRVLRALTPTEVGDLRAMGVIEERRT